MGAAGDPGRVGDFVLAGQKSRRIRRGRMVDRTGRNEDSVA